MAGGKSTGPKTVAGKARSAMNALKHGRYAKHPSILPIEDDQAFKDLFRDYLAHYAPGSALEVRLVQELVHIDWSLMRMRAVETGYLGRIYEGHGPAGGGQKERPDPAVRLGLGLERSVNESGFASYLSVRMSRLLTDRTRTMLALARARKSAPLPAEPGGGKGAGLELTSEWLGEE